MLGPVLSFRIYNKTEHVRETNSHILKPCRNSTKKIKCMLATDKHISDVIHNGKSGTAYTSTPFDEWQTLMSLAIDREIVDSVSKCLYFFASSQST